ncbi:hypothetical protein Q8F55_002655 [Vanrija albida]|uniref:CCD97-like C-terminal domain-containing protein n=1 Tax=Vanrija albida TaxID=181172 RepID=A0ABR3QAD2_9TREE
MSSPTPAPHASLPLHFSSPTRPSSSSSRSHSAPRPLSARYTRPTAPRRPSGGLSSPADLFADPASASPAGATPTETAMWKDKLQRRMHDRARRKKAHDADIARRRGSESDEYVDDDEAERRAQEEDEEIFRRLMVLQRRREQHAALVSHEVETGGSDPNLPDFWEDELEAFAAEERRLIRHLDEAEYDYPVPIPEETEEELWELEASAAEEAEREAEEIAVAMRVEEEMRRRAANPQVHVTDYDSMDLDEDYSMHID